MGNTKYLFMIVDRKILYLENTEIDFRQWCLQLGINMDDYENIIRGFITDKMIIFFKGNNFQYDEEVIKVSKIYGEKIKEDCGNTELDVYCGLLNNGYGNGFEPILKINEEELSSKLDIDNYINNIMESNNNDVVEEVPILEFKNNYQDDEFIAIAVKYTFITLVIDIVLKLYLFLRGRILHLNNMMDLLLVFFQIVLLLYCLMGYKTRNEKTKYVGLLASFFIVLTLDLGDVILGVLYFLFTLNLTYIYNIRNALKESYKFAKEKTGEIQKKIKK